MQESKGLVEIGGEIEGVWREVKRECLEAKSKDFGGEKRVFWVIRYLAEEQSMVWGYEDINQDLYIERVRERWRDR